IMEDNAMSKELEKDKTPSSEKPMLRGALKLEASTSSPIVSAGTDFSIYVVIRNPFPVPVTIHSTETHIPVELADKLWRKNEKIKLHHARAKQLNDIQGGYQKFLKRISYWFTDIWGWFKPAPSPLVAIAVTPENQEGLSGAEISIDSITVGGD